tara:strand:+ start:484 stop:1746 length:1263 start_codon:yes stop_codon:yes gene_type:complete
LREESKRLAAPVLTRSLSLLDSLEARILDMLLRPKGWSPPAERAFCVSNEDILSLIDSLLPILKAEPTLLQLAAPVKVFGDIHGQYADLMRIFAQFGAPMKGEGGDISVVDYLFLGDYVDRGKHSLETVILLLALKKRFPKRIFLVRGNHESPEVNACNGFLHECVERCGGKASGVDIWRKLNKVFEWMPMAATINGVILCVHGGIGGGVESLEQIASLPRPLRMGGAHADMLLDLLWSDPTKSDAVHGVHPNSERGAPVVSFGPDRVESFLEANGLKLIIRAHECVMDGFQRFASGRLITIFSATNYCNRWRNAGAILVVGKDLEIVPKMIVCVDQLEDMWLQCDESEQREHLIHMRPPTPPREREEGEDGRIGEIGEIVEMDERSEGGGGGTNALQAIQEDAGGAPPLMRPPTPPRDR